MNLIKLGISKLNPEAYLRKDFSKAKPCELSLIKQKIPIFFSFDVDLQADIEALKPILSDLKKNNIKASFSVIGKWVERFPEQHKLIVEQGHEIMNHTYSHPYNIELTKEGFDGMSYDQKKQEIEKGHNTIKRILGVEPKGFRVPHFGVQNTEHIYDILAELNYKYSSSVMSSQAENHGNPYVLESERNERIAEFPLCGCPKHPLGVFDSFHCFRSSHRYHTKPEFLILFSNLINICVETKHIINFYLDPQDCYNYNLIPAMKQKMEQNLYRNIIQNLTYSEYLINTKNWND